MAQLKVEISAVGSNSLTVIVECEDGSVWQWDTPAVRDQRMFGKYGCVQSRWGRSLN